MHEYEVETFGDFFSRLPLPSQIEQVYQMRREVAATAADPRGRPLLEIVEAINAIDRANNADIDFDDIRSSLIEQAVGRLLGECPIGAFRSSILSRDEILDLLPELRYSPPVGSDQIGKGSYDLTLGVPEGKRTGDEVVFNKGDVQVLSALERHGPWPESIVGYISVRSCFAQKKLEHLRSPWIYPGSERETRLELQYLGDDPLTLVYGRSRVVQVTLFRIGSGTPTSNNGHRNGHRIYAIKDQI